MSMDFEEIVAKLRAEGKLKPVPTGSMHWNSTSTGGNFTVNEHIWVPETGTDGIDSMGKNDDFNLPHIESMTFEFSQESNCIDGGDLEILTVEAKSSGGIHEDGGAFYVLKTEQWAIDGVEDMEKLLSRVDAAVKAAIGNKQR
jgi:hypothetical protein